MTNYYTEAEIASLNSLQTFQFLKQFKDNINQLKSIADYLPFLIYINSRETLDWEWGNSFQKKVFQIDYNNPSYELIKQKSHKAILDDSLVKINKINNSDKESDYCNYYQLFNISNDFKWLYTSKILLDKNYYLSTTFIFDEILKAGTKLQRVIYKPCFDVDMWNKYKTLTDREKQILNLISVGKGHRNIAEEISISNHTLRKHRENINRKLDMSSPSDLSSVIKTLRYINGID